MTMSDSVIEETLLKKADSLATFIWQLNKKINKGIFLFRVVSSTKRVSVWHVINFISFSYINSIVVLFYMLNST